MLPNQIALTLANKSDNFSMDIKCISDRVFALVIKCTAKNLNLVMETARCLMSIARFYPQHSSEDTQH